MNYIRRNSIIFIFFSNENNEENSFQCLDPACYYTINFYAIAACGRLTSSPSPSPTPSPTPMPLTNPNDITVLQDLYKSTSGENWIYNSNWMSKSDPCDTTLGWYGVSCLSVSQSSYVKGIFLDENNLQGTFPETLNNLSFIQAIDLGNNGLVGTLPMLNSLSSLMRLLLSSNKLSGTIPSNLAISSTNLMSLLIGNNQLSGSLSSTIYAFQNLDTLDLSNNNLTSNLAPAICDIKLFNVGGNNWYCPLPSCCGRNGQKICGPNCITN
jgi:hypothetical protein